VPWSNRERSYSYITIKDKLIVANHLRINNYNYSYLYEPMVIFTICVLHNFDHRIKLIPKNFNYMVLYINNWYII